MSNGHRSGGRRLSKQWEGLAAIKLALTADTTSGGGVLNFTTSITILRMIGEYVIAPTSAPAALDAVRIGVGIGVISTDAATLGPTAVPDPLGEPDFPWLYWADHAFLFSTTDPDSGGNLASSVRHRFDIRSMRKVKPRESLTMIVQYADSVGTPPMSFFAGQTRVLQGLH